MKWGEKQIACGILYQDKKQKSYEELIPWIVEKTITDTDPNPRDVSELFNKLI